MYRSRKVYKNFTSQDSIPNFLGKLLKWDKMKKIRFHKDERIVLRKEKQSVNEEQVARAVHGCREPRSKMETQTPRVPGTKLLEINPTSQAGLQ